MKKIFLTLLLLFTAFTVYAERLRTYRNLPVKHEKILEIAIMDACAASGWQAKKEKNGNSIEATLPKSDYLYPDMNHKLSASYTSEGYSVVYEYFNRFTVKNNVDDEKIDSLHEKYINTLNNNVDRCLAQAVAKVEPFLVKKEIHESLAAQNDKVMEYAVIGGLQKLMWNYRKIGEGKLEIVHPGAYLSAVAQLKYDAKGYKITYYIYGEKDDARTSSITEYSNSLKDSIVECLPEASLLAGARIMTFKGSAGTHHDAESLLNIIENGCKDAGWEITERKANNVTAVFNDKQGGIVTVNIYYRSRRYDRIITILGEKNVEHKVREYKSEYKITCKNSKGIKYIAKKDAVNPVNEYMYNLNLHINECIYKRLIK